MPTTLHQPAACAEHLSIAIANMKLREGLRDQSVRDVLTGLNNLNNRRKSTE